MEFLAIVGATALFVPSVGAAPTATEPCALVSSAWAAQISSTPTPTIEASIAYDCLNSVPINKDAALKFINEMRPYVEWQSDTAFKNEPPADYFYPPHDIFAAIEEVEAAVAADEYPNEYAWQSDLYQKVFGPGHDGHFVVYPDALSAAVEWQRPFALVSVSETPDGDAPVIKIYQDVISSPETASVVSLINGVDASTFVQERIFQVSGNQDADAAYNTMFFEKAFLAENGNNGYFQSGGRVRYVYPGNVTSFTFENGTEVELPNVARLKGTWDGVVDGPSFFAAFCPGASGDSLAAPTTTSTPAPTPASTTLASVTGYPDSVIVASDGSIAGYFLDAPGFEDVAVIVALTFGPEDPVEFQRVAQDFFAASVQAGKKKLVVDVSANGGGYIFAGYDLFRQLFPDIVQEGLGRWRESSGFQAVSDIFSAESEGFDPTTADIDHIFMYEAVYNWRYDLDIDNQHFSSYEDKFAPRVYLGDNYTDLMQWDFNNPLDTSNTTFGYGTDITGYRSRANFTRPFSGPEDIILLLDGYCASTCTLFSQFLKYDAGVKSIAMGGRPEVEGLIQGVGGVKGSQSYGYDDVLSNVELALNYTDDAGQIEELNRYTPYVSGRATAASLNVKDEIYRDHIPDGTPAQFIAEYSECRLWWTEPMITDAAELWQAVATAAFKGGNCAFGSVDYSTNDTATNHRRTPFYATRKVTAPSIQNSVARRSVSQKNNLLMNQFMKVVD